MDSSSIFDAADNVIPPFTFDEPIFMRLYTADEPVASWTPEGGWTGPPARPAHDYSEGRWLAEQERRPPWFGPDDVL